MLTRRGAMLAGAAAWAATARANAQAGGGPPPAKATPYTETVGGRTITDPYRWMEKGADDPDFVSWAKAQDAYARARLRAIPGRERLAADIARVSGDRTAVAEVQRAGALVFLQQRPPGADTWRLVVQNGLAGDQRVLIDPNARRGERHRSLDWWLASPDGARVVYGVSEAGSENSVLHVIETASGEVSPLRIDRVQYAAPSWLPDGSGFAYNQLAKDGAKPSDPDYFLNSVMRLHRLGRPTAEDVVLFGRDTHAEIPVRPFEFPALEFVKGSRWAVALLAPGVDPDLQLFTAPQADVLAGRARWRRISRTEDKVTSFAVRGDDLWLLTYKDAPRYRVLQTRAADGDLARARVAVPESERVITSIAAARDGLYLAELDGGLGRVRRLGANGLREVALPFDGSAQLTGTEPDQDGAFVFATNTVTPDQLLRVEPTLAARDTRLAPKPPINTSVYRQTLAAARAKDGALIPMIMVHRADLRQEGTAPTLLQAYGAYGVTNEPYFSPRVLPFLDRGGLFVTAGVRGGGEYGRAWHEAGRIATKANTWRDLIACGEFLVAERWTSPAKLGIQGTSAGGITVSMAMLERPDLFAVVNSRVGVNDVLRMAYSPGGPANRPEFGDPEKPDELPHVLAMSAYHQLKPGARLPAVLLTGGMTDPRVPPWQPAKLAARLQAAGAQRPVLLRMEFEAGHGLGSTRTQLDEEFADAFAFLLAETGGVPPG